MNEIVQLVSQKTGIPADKDSKPSKSLSAI
jgi:hypothetical protein